MNFETLKSFFDEFKTLVQSHNTMKAEIQALQTRLNRSEGVKPSLYTVKEACDLLGNGLQPLSREAFEGYRNRDLLRVQQTVKKGKVWVISKDVENLKKVLEQSKTHRLPPHFIRDWE